MTTPPQNNPTPADPAVPRPRHLLRWTARFATFLVGLAIVLGAADRYVGRKFAQRHGNGTIDPVIWQTIEERSRRSDPAVTAIILGDSVSAQLFYPGRETNRSVEYLTTNQAIGVPGQLHLLRRAAARLPNLREVYLLFTPRSWSNNLDGPLSHDYYAAFFHEGTDIAGVFRVKGDVGLAASQLGRWLLPNLLAANAASDLHLRQGGPTQKTPGVADDPRDLVAGSPPVAPPTEKLVDWLSALCRAALKTPAYPPLRPIPPGTVPPIRVSPLSADFLAQMRQFCKAHGLTLHVLPCPSTDARPFAESPTPYDAPLWYMPAGDYHDAIHLLPQYVDAARREAIRRYHMPAD
jgi:hypothetical protein